MKLYIDPGTGSMLFAILIGIIGALNFALRGWIIKLRFLLSGGEKTAVDQEKHPLAVFVDDKRYWNVMEPVCRELDRRGLDVAYLTASPDDPALQNPYAHVHAEFLGEGNKAFAKLNFLRANVLLSTTPGLDVYQWKRSPSVDCYVHILHAANEVAGYRMFGIDYYDTVFVSGDYQIRDLRALEALRGLRTEIAREESVPPYIVFSDKTLVLMCRLHGRDEAAAGRRRPHRAAQDDGAHRAVLGAERDLQQIRRQDHRQAARRRLPCHHSPAPPVVQVGKGHDRQAHGRLPGLGGSGVEPRQR